MSDQGLQVKIGADITDLDKGLKNATASLNQFNTGIKKNATQASFALNSLSQVARDLPFGFIAIQNNLPLVVDSFSQLAKTSGGAKAALSGLVSALAGPAGIAFAFGAVTAGVTALVQKYGSLSAAISAITGNQTKLDRSVLAASKSYDKFKESLIGVRELIAEQTGSVQGQISKITALSAAVLDNTRSNTERLNGLKELRKINKDYFGDLTLEESKLKLLKTRVDEYTQSLIQAAVVKGFETQISNVSQELFAQENVLKDVAKEFSKVGNAAGSSLNSLTKFGAAYQDAVKPVANAAKIEEQFKNQVKVVGELRNKYQELSKGIQAAVGTQLKLIVPSIAGVNEDLKGNPLVVPLMIAGGPEGLVVAPEDIKKIFTDIAIDAQFKQDQGIEIPVKLEIPQAAFESLERFGELKKTIFDNELAKKKGEEFKQILNDSLAVPLGDLFFNFLDKGKIGFKEFADVAIKSIKRIVAQLIASKIIQLLGTALTGGASGGVAGAFKFLTGAGAFLGNSKINFGNISGQSSAIGQVSFKIQGTELVGVLNQTNARIGRVG